MKFTPRSHFFSSTVRRAPTWIQNGLLQRTSPSRKVNGQAGLCDNFSLQVRSYRLKKLNSAVQSGNKLSPAISDVEKDLLFKSATADDAPYVVRLVYDFLVNALPESSTYLKHEDVADRLLDEVIIMFQFIPDV